MAGRATSSGSLSDLPIDDIFRHTPKSHARDNKWTVNLGLADWQKPYLVLLVQELCQDGNLGWVTYGRVDAVQGGRSLSTGLPTLRILSCGKVNGPGSRVFQVDPEKFSGTNCICHCSMDLDGIIQRLKTQAKRRDHVALVVAVEDFVTHHNGSIVVNALKRAAEELRKLKPKMFGEASGSAAFDKPVVPRKKRSRDPIDSQGDHPESIGRDSLGASAPSPRVNLSGPGSSSRDQEAALAQGSHTIPQPSQPTFLEEPVEESEEEEEVEEEDVPEDDVDEIVAAPPAKKQKPRPRPKGVGPSPAKSKAKEAKANEAKKKAKTPLEKVPTHLESTALQSADARSTYQRNLLERCAVQEETITVDIAQLYPPVRDKLTDLPKYQVRHIQPYFLDQLTRRMNAIGASPLATPFVLLVDPDMCPTRDDFDFTKKNTYKYYVIGGNHSACAKADLSLANPHNKSFRRVQSWIFAGLTVQEARNLAWGHNIDSEFRASMTTIQRVSYIHMRFVENGYVSNPEFKRECAMEINLKDWGVRKDAEVLNANDNLYQLAFRRDPEWSYIRQIFEKWENNKIKGQKALADGKGKGKKANPSGDAKLPYEDMKLTEWRFMQVLKDPDFIIPVLQKVLAGDYSLSEMGAEFRRHKVQIQVQKAFLISLHEDTWSACKAKYPEHCTDNVLQNFVEIFKVWVDPTASKRKRDGDLQVYPDKFNAHVLQAQAWLAMKDANNLVTPESQELLKLATFENPKYGDVKYDILTDDALLLHKVVAKRNYTLLLADIPYGLNVQGCLHDDVLAWGEVELTTLLQSFKVVTTARLWRVIILHSIDQLEVVKKVLTAECTGGIQNCFWYKPNVKNAGGARLNSNLECFTIGFHSLDGGRTMDHFNFGADEKRENVVTANSIISKLKHSGDNKVVNVYQKPRALIDWMVGHFSHPGDWVLDVCSGSGTALASSVCLGRHCVSIEKDVRQATVLRGRVLNLGGIGKGDDRGELEDAPLPPVVAKIPHVVDLTVGSGSASQEKEAEIEKTVPIVPTGASDPTGLGEASGSGAAVDSVE